MHTSPVSWSRLRQAAIAIYPKAAIGLVLIYVVYFLKKGGFETAPLEITLLGCLLALAATAAIHIKCPFIVAHFASDDEYEEHMQTKLERKFVNANFWFKEIDDDRVTNDELAQLGYAFDRDFDPTAQNLKTVLGEIGVVSFASRLRYLRLNQSATVSRWSLCIIGVAALLLMYFRPIKMLFSIYF